MAQTIAELVVQISAENAELKKTLNESVKDTNDAFGKIGKAIISAGAAIGVFGELLKGIEFNKAAEQAQVAFEVMLGSTKAAKDMLVELKDFANKTPMEFKDVRDAAQKLLAMGIEGDKVVGIVKMLGDVSGGNAEKMSRLANVFGQISTKGRLMGDDLMQLREIGFDPLKIIAEKTGESVAKLTDKMAKGEISFNAVSDAFKTATSAGGDFYQMLEKQSETLAGKQSTLNDAYETFLGALTEAFTGPLKAGITVLTQMLNVLTNLPQPILTAVASFAALGAALGSIMAIAPMLGAALPAAFGPIGVAVAGATALFVGLGMVISDNIKQANDFELAMKRSGKITAEEAEKALQREKDTIQTRITMIQRLAAAEERQFGIRTKQYDAYMAESLALMKRQGEISKIQQENTEKARQELAEKEKATKSEVVYTEDLTAKKLSALKKIEDANAALRKMEEENAEAIAKKNGERALNAALEEKKALEEIEAGHKAWQARLAKAKEEQLRKSIEIADAEAAAQIAAIEEMNRAREESFNIATESIGAISRIFSTLGTDLGKTLGDTFTKVGSIVGNIGKLVASQGMDISAWIALISEAVVWVIELFQTAEEKQRKAKEGAEAFKKAMQDMMAVVIKAVEDYQKKQVENASKRIEMIGTEKEKMADKHKREMAQLKEIGGTQADLDKLKLMQQKEWNEQFDEATKKANALAKEVQKTGESITSSLAGSLSAGMDKSGFMEKMRDMIKQMAITAALAAAGIQETINKIANAVAKGETGGIAEQLSALWSKASSVVSPIVSAIDAQFAAIPAFATGTDFAPGGMAVVGEQGPELVSLPRGSQVKTAAETRDMMGKNVTFVFNSPQELNPSEMMARARQSARELAFQGAF